MSTERFLETKYKNTTIYLLKSRIGLTPGTTGRFGFKPGKRA